MQIIILEYIFTSAICGGSYLYPPLREDYCLDQNEKCSESAPCSCCTRPHGFMCTKPLDNSFANYCVRARGICSIAVPWFNFTDNSCSEIEYPCDYNGINVCIARWIDVQYICAHSLDQLPSYSVAGTRSSAAKSFDGINNKGTIISLSVLCLTLLIVASVFVILYINGKRHHRSGDINLTKCNQDQAFNTGEIVSGATYEDIPASKHNRENQPGVLEHRAAVLPSEYMSMAEHKGQFSGVTWNDGTTSQKQPDVCYGNTDNDQYIELYKV